MLQKLSIGELARRTTTKVVTIRYYETIGLLPRPARTRGNYRLYSSKHLERLSFIRRSRALGFTLDQVRNLLTITEEKGRDCCIVDEIAVTHLADVESKLSDLSRLARELKRIIRNCKGGTVGDCRIIEALSTTA